MPQPEPIRTRPARKGLPQAKPRVARDPLADRLAARVGTARTPTAVQQAWNSGLQPDRPAEREAVAAVAAAARAPKPKPKRTRAQKVVALALTDGYNANEAAVARSKIEGDPAALITMAARALEQAASLPDIRDVRDRAAALQTYARSRSAGIDTENMAAVVVITAERMMGAELIRMRESGELAKPGAAPSQWTSLPAISTLNDLGLGSGTDRNRVAGWQRLALMSDDEFRDVIARKRESGERLARVDFVSLAPRNRPPVRDMGSGPYTVTRVGLDDIPIEEPEPSRVLPDTGDIWTANWNAIVEWSRLLRDNLDHGWPVQGDRNPSEWATIREQIMFVGRALLDFQRRVNEFPTGEDNE